MYVGFFVNRNGYRSDTRNRFEIAPETRLWRYVSFAKFAALLFFSRKQLHQMWRMDRCRPNEVEDKLGRDAIVSIYAISEAK
jgi:hypothetical protein